ncbi:MAG: hypothetical protein M3209_08115 [Acidobacteriota bacterium]|nr:hypothetical protein [Acidobacteriota bacterium]
MGEDERTWWFCSECGFEIEEDENKECFCGKCNSPLPSVSWLLKEEAGFYWCFSCNERTEQIKKDTTDYKAWFRELGNTNS